MIKEELELANKEFEGSDAIFGKNLLTFTNRINSSRGLMFSNMLDQLVPLEHTELPRNYTNYEDMVGKYSSAYYKNDEEKVIVAKLSKFDNNPNAVYILITKNLKTNEYDIIERKAGERLTETYGYKYNNEHIDSLVEGEIINKDEVLYHSTSFNDNLQFGYGVNALSMYTTDPMTIEDAIVISKSLEKKLTSIEYDTVRISLNDNDVLTNYMGDHEKYQCFPNIGEEIKDFVLANRRRISYSQALYDLKDENLRKVLSTDTSYYVPFGDDMVVDINVYCNKDPEQIKRTKYNAQIFDYYDSMIAYYTEIHRTLGEIVERGEKYSDDLAYLYKLSGQIIDPNYKWEDDNKKVFGNIILEITVEKRIGMVEGSKLAGRVGDKGIVSEIREDEDMPILPDGRRVEMIVNILGVGGQMAA